MMKQTFLTCRVCVCACHCLQWPVLCFSSLTLHSEFPPNGNECYFMVNLILSKLQPTSAPSLGSV